MMIGTRLARLEKVARAIGGGQRCPTCFCTGGDGRTGSHIVWVPPFDFDDPNRPVPSPPTEAERTCQTCGTVREIIVITSPLMPLIEVE